MSSDLTLFADSEITVRLREPFITQGLNKKNVSNTAPGIYRGFKLAANGASLTLTVQADPVTGDHAAVVETVNGSDRYSLSIRRLGSFTLDLSGLPAQDLIIALYTQYSLGTLTQAKIRAYTVAQFLIAPEQPYLVVLGSVRTPASGAISEWSGVPGATGFSAHRRMLAAESVSSGAVPWLNVLRNSDFEEGPATQGYRYAANFWEFDPLVSGAFRLTTSGANVFNGTRSLAIYSTAAATLTGSCFQWINIPVTPGQLVRLSAKIKVLNGATIGGSLKLFLEWADATGAVSSTTELAVPVTSTTTSFQNIDEFTDLRDMFAAPASPAAAYLRRVGIRLTNLSFAVTAESIFIDALQCHVETQDPRRRNDGDSRRSAASVGSLLVQDPTAAFTATDLGAVIRFDSATNRLIVERQDQSGTNPVGIQTLLVTGLAAPTSGTDAANKTYVDTFLQGLSPKQACRVSTTVSLAYPPSTLLTIDGVTVAVGDRVLVKDQATASQNGIYVADTGAWTRSTDANASTNFAGGAFVFVTAGTIGHDLGWVVSVPDGPINVGVDSITWVQFSTVGVITAGLGLFNNSGQFDFVPDNSLALPAIANRTLHATGSGVRVVGLPHRFLLADSGGTAQQTNATVTASALNELTGAGATSLHFHTSDWATTGSTMYTATAARNVVIGQTGTSQLIGAVVLGVTNEALSHTGPVVVFESLQAASASGQEVLRLRSSSTATGGGPGLKFFNVDPSPLEMGSLQARAGSGTLDMVLAVEQTSGSIFLRTFAVDRWSVSTTGLLAALAGAPNPALDLNSKKIASVANPTLAQDAATKNYADTRVAGATFGNAPAAGRILEFDGVNWNYIPTPVSGVANVATAVDEETPVSLASLNFQGATGVKATDLTVTRTSTNQIRVGFVATGNQGVSSIAQTLPINQVISGTGLEWNIQLGSNLFNQATIQLKPLSPSPAGTTPSPADGTRIPVITIDSFGRITSTSSVAVSGGGGGITSVVEGNNVTITNPTGPAVTVGISTITATQILRGAGASGFTSGSGFTYDGTSLVTITHGSSPVLSFVAGVGNAIVTGDTSSNLIMRAGTGGRGLIQSNGNLGNKLELGSSAAAHLLQDAQTRPTFTNGAIYGHVSAVAPDSNCTDTHGSCTFTVASSGVSPFGYQIVSGLMNFATAFATNPHVVAAIQTYPGIPTYSPTNVSIQFSWVVNTTNVEFILAVPVTHIVTPGDYRITYMVMGTT